MRGLEINQLIKLLNKGDMKALRYFIDNYSKFILKTISYILNNSYEAQFIEECYDDVIMIILKKCNSYEYNASFKTWIGTIAKNKALDYKRRIKKDYISDEIKETHIIETGVDEKILFKHKITELNNIVEKLTYDERKLLHKRFILELDIQQLSNEYMTNENVIYKRISRLRKKIRELIKNENKGEDIYE